MNTKLTDFLKKRRYKYLSWLIAFGAGCILTLGSMVRLGFFPKITGHWDAARLVWILVIILFALGLTFIFNRLFVNFLNNANLRKTIIIYCCLMVVYIFILVILFLTKGFTIINWLVSGQIPGKRGMIVSTAAMIMFFIIIPIILTDVVVIFETKYKNKGELFIWAWIKSFLLKDRPFFSPENSSYYHRFFLIIMVGMCLIPLYNAPNLKNLEGGFLGRKWLLNLFANTRLRMGDQVFNVSLRMNGNWFVYTGESSLDDFQNTQPFSPIELADIQRKLDRLDNLLKSKGIKLIVVVPPNKNTIYPEYMPPQVPVIGKQSRLDQLVAYEQQHGEFKIMDLRQAFLKARNEEQIYYPCDTHWNPYGAFVAYQEILKALEKDFPVLKVHSLEEFRYISTTDPCDITALESLNLPGGHFTLAPVFTRQVAEQDWQKGVVPGSFYVKFPFDEIITTHADSSLPRLVMYRDSFGVTLIPFLADHFSRGVYLWAFPEDESYYDSEKPDVVILEFTERYLFFLLHLPG